MSTNNADQLAESPPKEDDVVAGLDEPASGAPFPVVGVGASAGGLEAFTQLLKALPADTGMAFVLVQHLAPSHASALAEILSRATKMPVTEVRDEPIVEPNHVYVIPPDRSMIIVRGALQLFPREGRGAPHPIDQFFRSLAVEQRHRAIGVVLSGTATDGTLGLGEIKAEGGITFAQDETAQHEGMPHSAIASGCVDFVLAPAEIAREIALIGQHPYAVTEAEAHDTDERSNLAQVVQLLLDITGVDFTGYKFNTLYRRVTRRMVFQKMSGLAEYIQYLRQTPAELDALYQDILISVTSFFRDSESFETLKRTVFPRLLKDRSRHDPVRLWTLGCSTGEEAYSLAIAFMEAAEAAGSSVPVQLFASDLNAAGIEKARAGVYPKDIAQDVSPERLRRFFSEVDGHYRIAKSIRDSCVFSRHNVLADPPFSRIDLISCRNLLIYLEPVLQQRIMPMLHYALKAEGCLWLGGSETIGAYRNLFEAEDAKHKIYSKKPGPNQGGSGHFPLLHGGVPRSRFIPTTARPGDTVDLHREADRVLLTKFTPPGVLVNADLDILQYRGDTGSYLAPAPGKSSLNLLKMLREGLLVAVRATILRADKEQSPVREEGLRVKSENGYREVAVEVIPLKGHGAKEGGFLVLFEEDGSARVASAGSRAPEPFATDTDNARLQQELAATREYLQSVIEQQEAANEELQSANEEVQSANEELQSTNEELETSKEEIQSSNEELSTVNDELHHRNEELHRVNNDIVNLLSSVQMAIVMLGPDLRVRRFTPMAEKLLNLIPSDVGRPLTDIKLNLDDLPDLEPLLADVLDTISVKECEVRGKQGRWYSLRLRPYRTTENKIDGVVVMLVDVDAVKRAEIASAHLAAIVASSDDAIISKDLDSVMTSWNKGAEALFGYTAEEAIGKSVTILIPSDRIDEEASILERIRRGETIKHYETVRRCKDGRLLDISLTVSPIRDAAGRIIGAAKIAREITEQREMANQLRQYAANLSEADRRKNEFLAMLAHELRNPLAPIRNALQILRLKNGDGHAVYSASEMMERQVGQMVRLVDDLLDVSRVSRGKIELRVGRIELASVVNQAVEAVRPSCEKMEHELTVKLPPQPIYLNADPTRLAQLIGNLLNNACKFTDKGGRISLAVERDGEQAIIRVRDNGVGIAADQLPRIFDMFTQVDTSLERSVSGLGIGLTLVKRLVEMHGGTVEVSSAGLGHGSEFVVRLPALAETAQTPPEPVVNEPTPRPVAASSLSMTTGTRQILLPCC
jgi:two-component system, chemotaxis family, CheB/CheR fusion protein